MRNMIKAAMCATLLVAVATPGLSGIVLWQDNFNDASHWQLNGLTATPNGTTVTYSATDPFVAGSAMRMSTPELLPWYPDAWITNTIEAIVHLDVQPLVPVSLRVYANTYSQPVLSDAFKIESKLVQDLGPGDAPGTFVSNFAGFTWGTTSGGELPSYVNFTYELASALWENGVYFTADHFSYSVVPEPGTLLIGGILAGLSGVGLRRKRAKAKA